MKRREFITLLGSTTAMWPLTTARAQQPRPRIAYLSLNSVQDDRTAAFVEGLRDLGRFEGKTVDIDYRYAEGDTTRLVPLARELIALKPDVALVNTLSSTIAMKSVSPDLPLVCPTLSDVAVPKFAASYARPGGTVTGLAAWVEGVVPKSLELAMDVVSDAARIGLLTNPTGASMGLYRQQFETAARIRSVTLVTVQARTAEELAPAFDSFGKANVQAVIVPANALFVNQSSRIAQLALSVRVPTIFGYGSSVESGGLASYGVDVRENYRRAAVYVDKILKGAKPGDLPIEFPTKLVLVINLKTAKALGLTVPPTLLARADEVIE